MAGEKAILDGGMDRNGAPSTMSGQVRYWIGEIAAALKREKEWRKEGTRILKIHDGKKKDEIPFNILYSNTETWLPALYNNSPRPVVQRRFKDEDPLGKLAAQTGQRGLEFSLDTNSEEYSSFDDVMSDVVLDGLLPGRGSARVKYDADIPGEVGQRYLKAEYVCFESTKWNRWVFGYANKWKKVPWIAFEHEVTYKEAAKLFTEEKAKLMTFTEGDPHDSDDKDSGEGREEGTDEEERKTALVYEIWHKDSKEVRFFSPTYKEGYLKVDRDPLGLTGFYPIPEPLRFVKKSNDQLPVALYTLYENQARELNRITTRINKVVEALKVRGAYDSTLGGDIENILDKDDNTLVPAENVAGLQDGGLEKAIWLMPLDKLATVLQQLILARQQCKQVIYEITGISDILRGQSVASETATAQEIKNQWGTLRLKRMQREVQRYARDLLRIALEIQAKKFNEKTWAAMTGLPYTTKEQIQAAQGQAAALRSQAAMMGGQPSPDQMKQVQQVQQVLQAPSWEKVLATLRNDTQRQYRIDIETNSTVDLEATEDQKMMNEVFTAISSFLQGVSPLVISGSMPFEAAQAMLLVMVRRYRFGVEIEDYIKQMKPPQNPDAGKQQAEQAKMQAEGQKMQFEMKKAQDEHALSMQEKQAEIQAKKEIAAIEMQVKREELELKREELRIKKELLMAQFAAKKATLEAQVAAAHAMPKKTEAAGANT